MKGAILFLISLACAGYVEVTLGLSGGIPGCTNCGKAREYACSQGVGKWDSGVLAFTDPLPTYGKNTVLKVNATVFGSYNCMADQGYLALGLTLNGVFIDIIQPRLTSSRCACNTCDGPINYKRGFSGGWPAYNYHGKNQVKLQNYGNQLCVNKVILGLEYGEIELDEAFVSVPLTGSTSGFAACHEYNRYISVGSSTVRFSFADPTPANAIVLRAVVALYGRYLVSNSYTSNTITIGMVNTAVGTVTSRTANYDTYHCDGAVEATSPIYQMGWPGFLKGQNNTISLSTSVAPAYLARADVTLAYWIPSRQE